VENSQQKRVYCDRTTREVVQDFSLQFMFQCIFNLLIAHISHSFPILATAGDGNIQSHGNCFSITLSPGLLIATSAVVINYTNSSVRVSRFGSPADL
jgi:hypothetical protein